jgi:glutamine amidotransferase
VSRVVVLDYGVGNLRNVARALRAIGAVPVVATSPAQVGDADRLVLPGVGAFGDSISEFRRRGFDQVVAEAIDAGKPLLGICVGYQMLFEESLEFGRHTGLGFFEGRVERFPGGIQVPHVGWNEVAWADGTVGWYYFVHSFRPVGVNPAVVVGSADYGGPFPAAVRKGSVWGVQFHPEKSQKAGLKVLADFLAAPVAAAR